MKNAYDKFDFTNVVVENPFQNPTPSRKSNKKELDAEYRRMVSKAKR